MRNDFIPGPRYKAARSRFMASIPEAATLGGAALSILAWEDTYEAAVCRFLDARAALLTSGAEALRLPAILGWLARNLKGEK